MKYYIFFFLFFSSFISYAQTCIIAKKFEDCIYVAGDSRVTTITENNGIQKIDTSSIQKIYFLKNVGYAVIGNYGILAIEMLRDSLQQDATAKSIQNIYAKFFFGISDSLIELEHKNPRMYHQILKKDSNTISQLIIFGRESDSLFIYSIKIYYDETENKIKFQPSVRTDLMYGGKTEEIKDTLETHSIWINRKEKKVIKLLRGLINISSRNHPIEVGGKTWILKVTMSDIKWL